MIAFATCVASEERFRRVALPGLRLACEEDSLIVEGSTDSSIFSVYNEVIDALAARDDLEALVLMHDDVEITDAGFCWKIRRHLQERPDLAVLGTVGARNVASLRWWEGDCFGRVLETRGLIDFGGGIHEVEMVDGLAMVISPWAVRKLRFDEDTFTGFHGYDADICFQARAAGGSVVVDDLALVHHTKGGYGDEGAFMRADAAWREKWGIGPLQKTGLG